MSKDLYFENNSNINMNNNNNVFSNNSSYNDLKVKLNRNSSNKKNNIINKVNIQNGKEEIENKSTRKDLTYVDKFKFIKDCLQKVKEKELNENTELNDLKQYEKTFLSKIKELKDDISELTKKIDEVKIAKMEVDKKIKNKGIVPKANLLKYGEIDAEMNEENEDRYLINEGLKNEIKQINGEMKEIGEEIKIMSEQSLDIHEDIATLKKKCDNLIKNNLFVKKNIQIKEKELLRITLNNKKINDKINQQEINSEKFLKKIDKWANKESNIKYNNSFDANDAQ